MSAIRAGWTSASFLVYAGALTVLSAAVWLISILGDRYGAAAFAGWTALVFACSLLCAFGFRLVGRPLLAGLFAFVSATLFGAFILALEDWFGWLHDKPAPLEGFPWAPILAALLVVVFALWALRVFHHPLLVLAAAGVGWYLVTEVLSNGGNWSAWVSILYGLVLLLVAASTNRVYGFWLHVVSGLTIGGGLLWFWHESDWNFILIGLVGLAYIFFGGAKRRSSWTVLGAVGLFLTTAHFVDKWFGSLSAFFLLFGVDEGRKHDWARPLGFVVLGFVFVGLGIVLHRRDRESATPVV